MSSFEMRIYENGMLRKKIRAESVVEIGRQRGEQEPGRFTLFDHPEDGLRFVVASATEVSVPRQWFRLSAESDETIRIENVHQRYSVTLSDGQVIGPKQMKRVANEPLIDLGRGCVLRASALRQEVEDNRTLLGGGLPTSAELATFRAVVDQSQGVADPQVFVALLRQALTVVREAAGSDAFFVTAVETVTRIVGLDRAVILIPNDDQGWTKRSEYLLEDRVSLPPLSDTLLDRVLAQRSTQIYNASKDYPSGSSLRATNCAVAAPILDHDENVVGILYGDRGNSAETCHLGISDVEATLVEVLASAVAAGIARQAEERSRARLADFFSPRVAEQLARRPELLTGQDVEVTVLFCDIRGFSSISEMMGPTKTIEWLNDVLNELSQCVVDRDGVLVDYVGDQVMAMWGAPQVQPDHARRGLEAAVEMLDRAQILRERWRERLPRTFNLGIGLNTGLARVGNTGSRLKFKYGVLGNNVNVASRLQSVTKQLGVNCLAAAATVDAAEWKERTRRLAVLNVVNIDEPITVYEIVSAPDDAWTTLRDNYESALEDFEAMKFGESTRKLGQLAQSFPEDRPSQLLLQRAVAALTEPSENFTSVWKFTNK